MDLTPVRRAHPDAGDIVIGWLTRIVVVVGLVGFVLFDAISIGVSRLSVEDAGALAAREASTDLARHGDVQAAYAVAVSTVQQANPLNQVPPAGFEALPDGRVRFVVAREATTFVVHRVGWIEDWAHVEATVSGAPLP